MNIFDPKRPQANGSPMYLSPEGKPIAVMPRLSIGLASPEVIQLTVFLLVGQNSATAFHAEWPLSQLTHFMVAWETDPEGILSSVFGYTYEPGQQAKAKAQTFNLSDIGL